MNRGFRNFIISFIVVATCFCSASKSYAVIDRVRPSYYSRDENGNYVCETAGIKELGITVGTTAGFIGALPIICRSTSAMILAGAGIAAFTIADVGLDLDFSINPQNPTCIPYLAEVGALCLSVNKLKNPTIRAVVGSTAFTALVAHTASAFTLAANSFDTVKVCGHDWLVWGHPNDPTDAKEVDEITRYPRKGAFKGSYKKFVEDCVKDASNCSQETRDWLRSKNRYKLNITDKEYREYIYQGKEFENTNCVDPRPERSSYDVAGSGQLYYMRGTDAPNFACDRFKRAGGAEYEQALHCCIEASEKYMCLVYEGDLLPGNIGSTGLNKHTFCSRSEIKGTKNISDFTKSGEDFWKSTGEYFESIGENFEKGAKCNLNGVFFEIFKGQSGNKLCARTWSACPYNHNVAGGTEIKMFYETVYDAETGVSSGKCVDDKTGMSYSCDGQLENFCQFDAHCVYVEPWRETPEIEKLYSPYIDKACMNFVGSSHNTTGYESYGGYFKLIGEYRSFAAPVAECINETMKNFLFNKAGHTRCKNSDLIPTNEDECSDQSYMFKAGHDLADFDNDYESRITKFQEILKDTIFLVVSLALVVYAIKLISKGGAVDKKGIAGLLIRVVIVLGFASGTWWYDYVFGLTYGISNTLSEITMKFDFDDTLYSGQDGGFENNYIKYDGCYFGYSKDLNEIEGNNNYSNYGDRTYISIFDALDCKMAKYLGYGVGAQVPNIFLLIGSSLLSGLGVFLFVGSYLLAFIVISFVVKAVYIFVVSSIAIAVLLFVSPLMIPAILFDKTRGMFDGWFGSLIGFMLQPMVLFAFLSISLSLMDRYILGEAIYVGTAPNKELLCTKFCREKSSGNIVKIYKSLLDDTDGVTCSGSDLEIVNMNQNSFACFLANPKWEQFSGLSTFGISIPVIIVTFSSNILTMLSVVFLMFILNKLVATVPSIAETLTGGSAPGAGKLWSTEYMTKKFFEISKRTRQIAIGLLNKYKGDIPKMPKNIKDGLKGIGEDAQVVRGGIKKGVNKVAGLLKKKGGGDTVGRDAVRDAGGNEE